MNEPAPANRGSIALRPLLAAAILVLLLIPVHLFNRELFQYLNSLHVPGTDMFWLTFTTMGDGLFLGIITGAFVVKNPRVTVLGLLLIVASSVVVQVLKAAFPTPRPAEALGVVHVLGPLLRSGSFPSGHTASALSAALAVWHCSHSRAMRCAAMIVGVLIGLSRIFVGAHFPQDVIGGAICALTCFVLIDAFVWPALQPRIPDRPILSRRSFQVALWLEIAITVFAILVWGPCAAESPVIGVGIGIAVLTFVIYGRWKLARGDSVR